MSKEKRVTFRIEEAEFERLESHAKSQGMKVSKYMRYLVSQDAGYMTVSHEAEKDLRRYFADANRLGNNFNQMMREINSGFHSINDKADEIGSVLDQTRPILINIKDLLVTLVRQTRV